MTPHQNNIWWTDTAWMPSRGQLWCTVSMVTFVNGSVCRVYWTILMVKTKIGFAHQILLQQKHYFPEQCQEYVGRTIRQKSHKEWIGVEALQKSGFLSWPWFYLCSLIQFVLHCWVACNLMQTGWKEATWVQPQTTLHRFSVHTDSIGRACE